MFSVRFRYENQILEYKPYPRYPTWLPIADFGLELTALADSIAALDTRLDAAESTLTNHSGQIASLQEAVEDLEAAQSTPQYHYTLEFMHYADKFITGTPVTEYQANYLHATRTYTTTQNAKWERRVVVEAGTYNLQIIHDTALGRGKLHVYVDGVEQSSIDMYAGSTTPLVISTVGSHVLSGGAHLFEFIVSDKNAASSGYLIAISAWYLQKT